MKTKIIFAYPAMMIGGSTTSLLSILNRLDYNRFDVDLLLNTHTGELLNQIPVQVNLLPPAKKYTSKKSDYLHRLLSPRYIWYWLKSRSIIRKSGYPIQGAQYREWKDIDFYRDIPGEYDVAIAFLEGDRCKFVARHVKAKRKIAWIHVNYIDAHFNPEYDRDTMCCFEKIVTVSEICKEVFCKSFPELSSRTVTIENILTTDYVRKRAGTESPIDIDKEYINLITTCRISFDSKGLDRAVDVMSQLLKEGYLNKIRWYIIGDGEDKIELEKMIKQGRLQDHIILCGMQINPYKYLIGQSLFFLPSKHEGKPMSVTEAMMMGLPALVTEYGSSHEQIRDGIDGMIVSNTRQGIYDGLKFIQEHPEKINTWKKNVLSTDYSNSEEFMKVVHLIEE
ncbi:MAG: glycosyltransferase [Treponema sp.]|nr:glycosyltransferase [Treponema sp.]